MASPADQRLLDLLEKWLVSLDLHAKYCALDAESYLRVQPWPKHQRPSRWIIDLARQKALTLQRQLHERINMGDSTFSESLELMTFLANLVGAEHIERFIPLAEPGNERAAGHDTSQLAPGLAPGLAPAVARDITATTGTREMPKFGGTSQTEPPPVGTNHVARTERKAAEVKHEAKSFVPPAYNRDGPSDAAREQVIADAARLVQWGRKWYELAELIASMADRPHVTDVRRILKDNKAVIDERAGRT
jgi:hypothetical protein